MTEIQISFPGIGIDWFTVDKVAFSIGSFSVRWYGIILTLGILCGVIYAIYRGKHEKISTEDVLDYAIWVVLLAVIGARLYYVLTTLKTDSGEWRYDSFLEAIAIWKGGIAIYGAIIGGALGVVIVSKVKKYNMTKILKVCDMVAPGVMLGQIIGRWGNFFNGEAHGVETTSFLRMGLMGAADTKYPHKEMFYHPTFLYESLWNLIGFILINIFYKKKKYDGQILLAYLAWYGFGRMLIEGLRTDSLYIGVFRISQVVGFLCFVICSVLLVYFQIRAKRKEKDKEEYESQYEKLQRKSPRKAKKQDAEDAESVQEDQEEMKEEQAPEVDIFDRAPKKEG